MARPGVRERNLVRRRDAIQRATLELSLERSYDETTIDDTSERAEIARRTVFDHYPSKEQIVFGVFEDTGSRMRDLLTDDALPVMDRVAQYLAEGREEFRDHDPLHRLRLTAIMADPTLRRLLRGRLDQAEQLIAEQFAVEYDRAPADVSIKILAGGVTSIFVATIEAFVADPTHDRSAQIVAAGMSVLRRGAEALSR